MFKSLSTTSTTTTTRNSSKLKIFVNKEPEFENGFYRLNFDGRVSMASVKNFQVVEAEVEEALENLSKKKTNKTTKNNKKKKNETTTMDTGSTTQKKDAKVLLQFGKVNENKFHLDFTAPITPIQAFGVAIAQFNL
jgi:tubby-related protein 1